MTIRVRLWFDDYDEDDEPDEVLELEADEPLLWKEDPRYHQSLGIDVHPEDCPATLNVYTSDSVHGASGRFSTGYVDESYWDGPMERGLTYGADHDYPPFGCEIWGRILFHVEEGA